VLAALTLLRDISVVGLCATPGSLSVSYGFSGPVYCKSKRKDNLFLYAPLVNRQKKKSLAKQFFDVTRMMEARRSARVTTANGMQDGSVAAEVVGGPHDSTLPTFASDGDDGIVREDSNTAPVATITHPAARPNQGFFDRAMEGIVSCTT